MSIVINVYEKSDCKPCDFRAAKLGFSLSFGNFTIKGDHMTATIPAGQECLVTVAPLLADGVTPSLATLSNLVFNTGGPFVVKASVTPNAAILQCPTGTVSGATDTLSATATATEPDGVTTEQISGSLSCVAGTAPVGPAASLGFTLGPNVPIGTNQLKK